MFLLKIYMALIFSIVFLLFIRFSVSPNRLSTSSGRLLIDLNKSPNRESEENEKKINDCMNKLYEVFDPNGNSKDHAIYAIKKLTRKSRINSPAMLYYTSFVNFLIPDKIPDVNEFCKKYTSIEACTSTIYKAFHSFHAETCLITAFFELNEDKIDSVNNVAVTEYFVEIINKFDLGTNTRTSSSRPFYEPEEFCIDYVQKVLLRT